MQHEPKSAEEARELGELLIFLRYRRQMRMAEVAAAISVPRSSVYRWEAGRGLPENHRLQLLLEFYQASADEQRRAWLLRARPVRKTAPRGGRRPRSGRGA